MFYLIPKEVMAGLAVPEKSKISEGCFNIKKQMKLSNFCTEYDIARTTVLEWVHAHDFPAYNLRGRWYVDIDKYLKWRENQHRKSYKYSSLS